MVSIKAKKLFQSSCIKSAVYVGFGTISLLGIMTNMPFYNDLFMIGVLLCMPVDFIGFGILYTEGFSSLDLIIGSQSAMFFVMWFILYRLFR